MLVYSNETPVTGNRLSKPNDHYEECDLKTDFTRRKTVQDIVISLESMCAHNIHIVGSRGYVYHTGKLAKDLIGMHCMGYYQWNVFPRSCGLREALIRAAYDSYSEEDMKKCLERYT